MTKSISSLLIILIFFFLTTVIEVTPDSHFVRPYPKVIGSNRNRAASSLFNVLHPVIPFKESIDPSEPFQCPQSQQYIALQFICHGHPGDCPDSLDENEEACIAAKRLAKENIEKFLHAAYTFLFTEKTFMSSGDLAHFRNIFQLIHDGRLEDIPLFAQEAVNQGLAALVEKLDDSGFMD
ncbi:unnamed protein product [Adineta steineri]|uniref:Uncharacterized protein n=1 Tax=Adineta steineri TaxID=433720 RepID=A0A813TPN4_9BILA|nr:unnamed protein product [Adineta steineri]CAF0821210.1 unnamed protein product [Adineta steineri]